MQPLAIHKYMSIELTYFNSAANSKAYQVIQFRKGEPWRIVENGELLGSIEKLDGQWKGRGKSILGEKLVESIGVLIDRQHFQLLPEKIKAHWENEVNEVIAQSDERYLVICRAEVDFASFAKLFRSYIHLLVKDPWEIKFNVYNADMSLDFEIFVQYDTSRRQ